MKLIIYFSTFPLLTQQAQQQRPQTTDITDMKRQQVAATTTVSAIEEGTYWID